MPLLVLFIGAVFLITAIRNTQSTLATALIHDVPGYFTWAAAILAIGALGFIPKLRPVSRGLMALVVIVILVKNYSAIIAGFQAVKATPASAAAKAPPTPAETLYQQASAAGVVGGGSGGSAAVAGSGTSAVVSPVLSQAQSILQPFEAMLPGLGGFGDIGSVFGI